MAYTFNLTGECLGDKARYLGSLIDQVASKQLDWECYHPAGRMRSVSKQAALWLQVLQASDYMLCMRALRKGM